MSIYRPADLTLDEIETLVYLLGNEEVRPVNFEDWHRLGALRAAAIKHPDSPWCINLYSQWKSYMERIAAAKEADDNAPIPGTTGSWCVTCGHALSLHNEDSARYCMALKGLTHCGCQKFEPKGEA